VEFPALRRIKSITIEHYRRLITALQLRSNIYPMREFLARGRRDSNHVAIAR